MFSFVILLSSCAFQRSETDTSNKQKNVYLHEGNGEAFHGGDGDGFKGVIGPVVNRIYTRYKINLKPGAVLKLEGSDFKPGISVKLVDVDCVVIELQNTGLTCSLSESLTNITSVSVRNLNSELEIKSNPKVISDEDGDGVPDELDNCVQVWNPNQKKSLDNQWQYGDECSPDITDVDGDGIADSYDNCENVKNPEQEDINGNSVGDACELDDGDNDGFLNYLDNCPDVFNPSQEDLDNNGDGDACS